MVGEYTAVAPNLNKQIIREGRRGRRPSLKWICSIDFVLSSSNEKEAKQSGKAEITMGDGTSSYDRLLERCLETMHIEEESLFQAKYPGESDELYITITLRSAVEKPHTFQWTDDEKFNVSNVYKNMGTKLFNEGQVEEAFYKFSSALKLVLTSDAILENYTTDLDIDNLRVTLYNNLALCHLHYKNYTSVIELCNSSIKINNSVKALYRRALAYIELKEYECAENDLIELLKLEPRNKAGKEKYKEVRELDRSNRESYQSILKKMFQ